MTRWIVLGLILLAALVITWQVDVRGERNFATYAYPAIIVFAALSTLFLKYSGFFKGGNDKNREMD